MRRSAASSAPNYELLYCKNLWTTMSGEQTRDQRTQGETRGGRLGSRQLGGGACHTAAATAADSGEHLSPGLHLVDYTWGPMALLQWAIACIRRARGGGAQYNPPRAAETADWHEAAARCAEADAGAEARAAHRCSPPQQAAAARCSAHCPVTNLHLLRSGHSTHAGSCTVFTSFTGARLSFTLRAANVLARFQVSLGRCAACLLA